MFTISSTISTRPASCCFLRCYWYQIIFLLRTVHATGAACELLSVHLTLFARILHGKDGRARAPWQPGVQQADIQPHLRFQFSPSRTCKHNRVIVAPHSSMDIERWGRSTVGYERRNMPRNQVHPRVGAGKPTSQGPRHPQALARLAHLLFPHTTRPRSGHSTSLSPSTGAA